MVVCGTMGNRYCFFIIKIISIKLLITGSVLFNHQLTNDQCCPVFSHLSSFGSASECVVFIVDSGSSWFVVGGWARALLLRMETPEKLSSLYRLVGGWMDGWMETVNSKLV